MILAKGVNSNNYNWPKVKPTFATNDVIKQTNLNHLSD